jgi:hypothetical protein
MGHGSGTAFAMARLWIVQFISQETPGYDSPEPIMRVAHKDGRILHFQAERPIA